MGAFIYRRSMRDILKRVPQLHRLAVLDAVATAGSFTAAARELQISQPAVSRHMAALANELGFELFESTGRTMALTARGRVLADAIDSGLVVIERALDELDAQSRAFVIAVQPAMATSWVVPLLDQLETTANAEIRLRIFERRGELENGQWDLAIIPGIGDWPGLESSLLFREAVRPLASPALAAELGLDETSAPSDLVDKNLMHLDPAGRPNMDWSQWFLEAGEPVDVPKPRVFYNGYPTIVQEAIAGNGIALGWQHLLSDLVVRGLLVAVGPVVQRNRGGHHVCWPEGLGDERHEGILDRLRTEVHASAPAFNEVD